MPTKCEITCKENNEQVVRFIGRLTYDCIDEVNQTLKHVCYDQDHYIFDLLKVEQIDSSGIGMLVNTVKGMLARKERSVFIVDNQMIYELFDMAKLTDVFHFVSNYQEAKNLMALPDKEYWSLKLRR